MSTIGCKNCGQRKKRDLRNEVVINEPTSSPKPSYTIILEENQENTVLFDWKSMSKMV